jgi:uracil phosphoribosyltransferase
MSAKIILKAEDLDGYLTETDRENISRMHAYYGEALTSFRNLAAGESKPSLVKSETDKIIGFVRENGQVHAGHHRR